MKPTVLAEPILVGRERELDELQRFLDSAIAGKGTIVFVSGEAGSGKTRLASEFLNRSKKTDVTVLSGWCLSNAAVPYFPFLEAFSAYSSGSERAGSGQIEIKTWLQGQTEKQDRYDNFTAQAWKDQTFSAVVKELLFLSTNHPVILFIDDIHWADSASLSLLHYIARAISSERILALATFRSEEILAKKEEGQPHPLNETLRLMGREGIFDEIKLQTLSQVDVGKIAENMLGGKVNLNLVEKLARDSGGSPLFIVESLRMMFEQGNLSKENDQWNLAADKIGIPIKVKDVIGRRLDALKPTQRRGLNAASVLGEKFSPDLVAQVVAQENLAVLETLDLMEQYGRLVVSEGNYYRFDHAKIQEMLYDQLPHLMKQEYHLRIAKKMEAATQDEKKYTPSDIAYHYVQAGNKEKSIKYSLAAGKDALARFSNAEAIKHFTYVLQNLPEKPEKAELKMTALEGLGDAFYASMMFKEAARTFETLAKMESANRLRALRKAMEASFFQNDLFHLEELLKEADKCDSTDRLENARILLNRARVFTLQGRIGFGVENTKKALQVFEEEYALWDAAWTLIALGTTLPHLEQLEEGLVALFRSIVLFREFGDSRWLIEASNYAGMFLGMFTDSKKEGSELIEKAIKTNEDSKICDYLRLSQSYSMLAWINSATGNPEAALSNSLKALNHAEKTDSYWVQGMAYSNLTTMYAAQGDNKRTEEYFGKLMNLPHEVHLNAMVNAPLATAFFFASKNQWEQSMQVFNAMFDHFKANPNPGLEAVVKMSYAGILNMQGRSEEAKKQVGEALAYHQTMAKRFDHVNVYASLMAPIKVGSNQTFDARLDLINLSRENGSLVEVEGILPPELKVVSMSNDCFAKDGLVKFKNNKLEPFGVSTVKLSFQPLKDGVLNLNPQLRYVSDLGETKISKPKSITINVAAPPEAATESTAKIEQPKIEFESDISRRVFDFLASSFKEDYVKRRLTQERAGWRTFMDIAKGANVSKSRIYGSSGRHGQAIAELERKGIVETRLFDGERGRGGKITKARVAYAKETVKLQVNQENN